MISIIYLVLLAFFIAFFTGKPTISILQKLQKKGQPIREDGPKSHLLTKKGTPTMGGLIILLPILLCSLIWLDLSDVRLQIILFVTFVNAMLGGADDLLKLLKNNSNGIRGKAKLLLQCIASSIALFWIYKAGYYSSVIDFHIGGIKLDLGLFYIPFALFVIIGASNSVNLTDGLDGLVTVPIILSLIAIGYAAPFLGLTIAVIIGSCLGFLWYNVYPARAFMGDIGSLSLGSCLGIMAIISKQEIAFAIASTIFIIESLSVIIQVYYFKFTGGKRVFLMSPIHHHFEYKNYHEVTIVVRFWLISVISMLISMVVVS